MATYRRAAQDIAEVEYIVSLIDEDVARNLPEWSSSQDLKKIRQRLATQGKWQEIRDSLKTETMTVTAHDTTDGGAFVDAPAKEVKASKSTRGGDAAKNEPK